MINRRQFLTRLCGFPIIAAFPLPTKAEGLRRYQLTAALVEHPLGGPDKPVSPLWLYNGKSPGPKLTARKGETLEIDFQNRLDQPTTIHWHGIRNLNEMDGVPDVTQAVVEPGEQFTYSFPVRDAGTFWYHAHNRSFEQVARGLYGPLIVTDNEPSENIRDIVLMADDWRLDANRRFDEASIGSLHDWSHGGRLGNWLTVNGQSRPEIPIPQTDLVRLRFVNAANARVLSFQLSRRAPMQIIALDGAPCIPFNVDTLRLGPAQRADVIVQAGPDLGSLYEVTADDNFEAARFVSKRVSESVLGNISASPWYPYPDTKDAKLINIHMQGGAMGNLTSAVFEGEEMPIRRLALEKQKFWAFNGQVGGYEHLLADLNLGDTAILRVFNDSRWEHTMHLHGHHFWVKSKEFGKETREVLRDTYLMAPGETAELVFIADNPGLWLFHCHALEHHAGGMGGVISIS